MDEPQRWNPAVGRRLKSARGGLSIREAARRANFSEVTWRALESGVRRPAKGLETPVNPEPETLAAAAMAVGVDPDELFDMVGVPPSDRPVVAIAVPSSVTRIGDEPFVSEDEAEILDELTATLIGAGLSVDRSAPDIDLRVHGDLEHVGVEVKTLGSRHGERQRIIEGLASCLLYQLDHPEAVVMLYLTRLPTDERWEAVALKSGVIITTNYDDVIEAATRDIRRIRSIDSSSVDVLRAAAEQADAGEQKVRPARRPSRVREEPEG